MSLAEAWPIHGSFWLRPFFEELEKRSYVYALTAPGKPASGRMPGGGTQVLPAKLGPEAGLLGACILPAYSSKWATMVA